MSWASAGELELLMSRIVDNARDRYIERAKGKLAHINADFVARGGRRNRERFADHQEYLERSFVVFAKAVTRKLLGMVDEGNGRGVSAETIPLIGERVTGVVGQVETFIAGHL